MSVNSKMTAIADQIRALLGLTGTMGLDEMATHLGTEQSNVTAALAAIADKGVTVPDGSNSDSLAALIESIEAAGGGGLDCGFFTLAEDSTIGAEIQHNLGVVPSANIVIQLTDRNYTHPGGAFQLMIANFKNLGDSLIQSASRGVFSTANTTFQGSNAIWSPYNKCTITTSVTENTVAIPLNIVGGAMYFWIVFSEVPSSL